MNTSFYIEKRKDGQGKIMEKDRPVFMTVSFNGSRVKLGTATRADLEAWDEEEQRIKSSYPGSHRLNAWLDSLVAAAESAMIAVRLSGDQVDPEEFREMFNQLKPKKSGGFFDVFFLFMETNSDRWGNSTFRKIRTLYRHLKEFEGQSGNVLTFHGMDNLFLEAFTTYYKNKGYSESTLRKALNNLVWFLNWATDNGYNIFNKYKLFYRSAGPVRHRVRNQIYLQWDELMRLAETETTSRRMERAKDLFCFSCFTGIRYADLARMKKGDIREEEAVVINNSGKERTVPLNGRAKDILEKYANRFYLGNTAFPGLHPATVNKYLRKLGKEAGLERPVAFPGEPGRMGLLHEHLTTGVAVNTFIYNALLMDVPVGIISEFTGVLKDRRTQQIRKKIAESEARRIFN